MGKKRFSKDWSKIPLGVKALIVYQAVLIFLYLLFGFETKNFLFGVILEGSNANIFNFIILAIVAAITYGFLSKQFFAFPLAIGWYSFEILNALVSLISTSDISTFKFLLVSSLFVILINAFILQYLVAKKDYFKKPKRHFKTELRDKIFLASLIIILIVGLVVIGVFAFITYKSTTLLTKELVFNLDGKNFEEAKELCNSKIGQERDLCLVVLATLFEESREDMCYNIDNKFYQISCLQALGENV